MAVNIDDILTGKLKPWNIDGFMERFKTGEILQDLGLTMKRKIPNLPEIIDEYLDFLRKIQKENLITIHPIGGQYYSRVILLGNDSYYTLTWDIQRAKRLVTHDPGFSIVRFQVKDLWPYVDQDGLNYDYVQQEVMNDEPIILFQYEGVGKFFVIDGNHRLARKFQKNPNATIDAYVLDRCAGLYTMQSDIHRVLYLIHLNLNNIINYLCGTRPDCPEIPFIPHLQRWV